MAISRMQQPRQMYGLGSFVKKFTKKVTRPITKVAKKIVPKEIAGIMRTAAPFLPPGYREAAYLLGTARQTGRISPVDLALTAAPTFFSKTNVGQGIAQRVGDFKLPGMERNLREVMVGTPEITSRGPLQVDVPFADMDGPGVRSITLPGFGDKRTVEATSGILGKGGKMFQFGGDKGIVDQFRDFRDQSQLGSLLLEGDEGKFSPSKIAGIGITTLSLIQNSKTPEEAGTALAAATGDSDDYERGKELFATLPKGIFDIPEQFRLQSANGGRVGFSEGGGKDMGKVVGSTFLPDDEFLPKNYPLEFRNFMKEFEFQNERKRREKLLEMFEKYMESQKTPILEAKDGGLMRTDYAIGSDDKGVVNPFQPKPIGPVLPEEDKPFKPKPLKPIKMAGSDIDQRFMELVAELREAGFSQQEAIKEARRILGEKDMAKGGRVDYALGTRPTAEESGLGGLPIEADMRYTGGFMPYGAKEKADDVPARLSKNEFVFTADAVRAAGGGSVNEGAKKMYATMKQLEAKPEAKGMTA